MHQMGPRMNTGMDHAPIPAPTPKPHFQIPERPNSHVTSGIPYPHPQATSKPTAKNHTQGMGKKRVRENHSANVQQKVSQPQCGVSHGRVSFVDLYSGNVDFPDDQQLLLNVALPLARFKEGPQVSIAVDIKASNLRKMPVAVRDELATANLNKEGTSESEGRAAINTGGAIQAQTLFLGTPTPGSVKISTAKQSQQALVAKSCVVLLDASQPAHIGKAGAALWQE
ncbi:hypothetical protein BDK51DRAFT_37227 [Blyttiomyces helicus]|uniref:Uncharacterized protein n=1 Tax=Blyttiomyces helicus TaxID=388810 RepID=A0A4P9WQW8_9FUNG|nr:hypothetical protein BDK51DRAFT_37227 [Blyttiomyces helicus]|eukprot:RKO94228.1 hypothetical protein BDK51DRAFT_37227 [Blyttiomyces helicus]